MNTLKFATKKTVKQPVGALIVEAPLEQDHVLGGAIGDDFPILVEDGHWSPYQPTPELQKNRFGDNFMCVSYSNNNAHEFIHKRLFDEEINWSDIFLGKGSGTIRGRGNSKRAVAEWKRKNGFVTETRYPYTSSMTLDQVYKPLTKSLLADGLKGLEVFEFGYKWLSDNKPQTMLEGLKRSPLQVDVQWYAFNSKGQVIWNKQSPSYVHEVLIFDYIEGKEWHVFDSEHNQYLKYVWDYPFGSPMIHSLKKNMKIELYKRVGQAGIAVKTFGEPSLIVFSGGSVIGERLFKSIYGITNFSELPIAEVKEWPHPIKHILNCTPYRGN